MFKKIKISIFILSIACLFLTACPEITNAKPLELNLQVPIGDDTGPIKFTKSDTSPIANYITVIYKYAIGIVGILATVVMMYGGVLWIMAGGSPERVTNAKSWIVASVTGLVLALTSYTILYTINPALVEFRITNVRQVKDKTVDNTCSENLKITSSNPLTDVQVTDRCNDRCNIYNSNFKDFTRIDEMNYCCICSSTLSPGDCFGRECTTIQNNSPECCSQAPHCRDFSAVGMTGIRCHPSPQ
ncbi:MAG: pilin [Candidatus Falkowbacteria bacterium]